MKLKVLSILLALVVLALAAFTAYDRWPQSEGEYPAPVRWSFGVSPTPKPCSEFVLRTLRFACVNSGGEACTLWVECNR